MGKSWTSEAFQLSTDTCVDVKADAHGVVLGQQGEVWMHNLHMSATEAAAVGGALIEGASMARSAGRAH